MGKQNEQKKNKEKKKNAVRLAGLKSGGASATP
jgi:hypothetical protein